MPHAGSKRAASLLVIALIGTGVIMISTLGEFVPGLLASVFSSDLGTPSEAIGILVTTIFLTSCVCAFPAGWLADRLSPSTMLLLQVVSAAAVFGSFAFAQSTVHLFITCGLVGLVMAFNQPATNRLIINYLPAHQHATAIGWRSVGVQAGMVLGSLLFAATADFISWRLAVMIITAIMLACGLWMFSALRLRKPIMNNVSVKSPTTEMPPRLTQSTQPITWWMIPYTLFTSGAISAVGAYFVIFGTDEIGLTLATASLASGAFASVSLLARVYWVKFLTDKNQVRLLFFASTSTAVAFLFLALTPTLGTWSFWIATLVIGATSTGSGPLSQIVAVKNTDPARIGTVTGWVSIGTFAGLTLQPVLLAVLIGQIGITSSWIAVAVTSMLGSATVAFFMLRYRNG